MHPAIVAQMKDDEAAHAKQAQLGRRGTARAVKFAMRAAAKVMTTTAHYL
jgi:ubiquinone biosynthesis monooxygenase Coq7